MDFQGNSHQLFSSGNDLLADCMFGWGNITKHKPERDIELQSSFPKLVFTNYQKSSYSN